MADLLRYLARNDRSFRMTVRRRIENAAHRDADMAPRMRAALRDAQAGALSRGGTTPDEPLARAVVLLEGRPSAQVIGGSVAMDRSDDLWAPQFLAHGATVKNRLRSVARVDRGMHGVTEQAGTCWVLDDRGTVVTNRHVAELFARAGRGAGFRFKLGMDGAAMTAHTRFGVEADSPPDDEENGWSVAEVMHIEGVFDGRLPDLAVMRLKGDALPAPVPLAEVVDFDRPVFTAGYPGFDEKHDAAARTRIFGEDRARYGVKRVAPGRIWKDPELTPVDWAIPHDCSTLRGSSGSLLADFETGEAVGLHFAGAFEKMNYAVSAKALRDSIRTAQVPVSWPGAPPAPPAPSQE